MQIDPQIVTVQIRPADLLRSAFCPVPAQTGLRRDTQAETALLYVSFTASAKLPMSVDVFHSFISVAVASPIGTVIDLYARRSRGCQYTGLTA